MQVLEVKKVVPPKLTWRLAAVVALSVTDKTRKKDKHKGGS